MNNNVYYGLRVHQKDTFDACLGNQRGIVTDTCGTGKSHVEFELICDEISKHPDERRIIVLAAHRLGLILQHWENFKEYAEKYHPELNGKYDLHEISSASRIEIRSTTKNEDIKNSIRGACRPLVFGACYHSIERLYSAIIGTEFKVDLMICDEAHYGYSAVRNSEGDEESEFDRYKFVEQNLVDRMYNFTATPFLKTMVRDGVELIHDYPFSAAVNDGVVLPCHYSFYKSDDGEHDENSMFSCVLHAYKENKRIFDKTSSKILVAGPNLEDNQILFNNLVRELEDDIRSGETAIAKFGSYKETDEGIVNGCEFVNFENLESGKYICDRKERGGIDQKMKDWIDPSKHEGTHKHLIIIHCQMLGIGVDIPNINGVVILREMNEANLYQTIMRPCRIAKFDRDVEREDRLEDHFEVYFNVPDGMVEDAVSEYMKKLEKIGANPFAGGFILNNVSGAHGIEEPTTAAVRMEIDKKLKEVQVFKFIEGKLLGVSSHEELVKNYKEAISRWPEQKERIESVLVENWKKFVEW